MGGVIEDSELSTLLSRQLGQSFPAEVLLSALLYGKRRLRYERILLLKWKNWDRSEARTSPSRSVSSPISGTWRIVGTLMPESTRNTVGDNLPANIIEKVPIRSRGSLRTERVGHCSDELEPIYHSVTFVN
jgi:hypothetical protein